MNAYTRLVHHETAACNDPFAATAVPIYQTATFDIGDVDDPRAYDYARSGNPTRRVLEDTLATLEDGSRGFAFSSGMAAIASLTRLLTPGDEVVLGHDVYGGTSRLFEQIVAPCQGVIIRRVDFSNCDAVSDVVNERTRLLFVESPSNPCQHVVDIKRLASRIYGLEILLAVDNTMMSPHLQRPLSLGADVVIHSATKFLGGHGDVTAGAVIVRDEAMAERLAFVQNAEGTALGPFDSFLLLRGIKTLGLRLQQQQATAHRCVEVLRQRPDIAHIYWVGLEDHPGATIHERQAAGPGSVVTIDVGSASVARALLTETRLFQAAVSFGGVHSSISIPTCMSHASAVNSSDDGDGAALSESLVRLSFGIEGANDLISDLTRVLDATAQPATVHTDLPITALHDQDEFTMSNSANCVGPSNV